LWTDDAVRLGPGQPAEVGKKSHQREQRTLVRSPRCQVAELRSRSDAVVT
jgi:hypothetical protein